MKKLSVALICVMLLSFTACNLNKQDNTSKVESNNVSSQVKVDKPTNETEKKPEGNKEEKTNENKPQVNVSQKNKYNIVLNEFTMDKDSAFNFTMTFKAVRDKVEVLGLDCNEMGDMDILVQDKNSHEEVVSIGFPQSSDKLSAKVNSITVYNKAIPTTLGLKVGDTIKEMEKLYGNKYNSYVDKNTNRTIYDYKMDKHIFRVESDEKNKDKVAMWHIL